LILTSAGMGERRFAEPFCPAFAAAASTSPNSVSVRRVAMDFAREVSFAEPMEGEGGTVSCGLSLEEDIRDALHGMFTEENN
jgi:hypothetical protein